MIRRCALILLLLAALAALTGCGTVGRYLICRTADLMDVFTLELTPALGLEMHMQMFCFGSSLGYADSPLLGVMMHGRRIGFGKRQTWGYLVRGATLAARPLSDHSIVISRRSRPYEPNIDFWGLCCFKRQGPRMSYIWLNWPELFEVSMGGTMGLVAVHMGVNPAEAVDFMLGFLTYDIARDDFGRLHHRGPAIPTGLDLPFLRPWKNPRR